MPGGRSGAERGRWHRLVSEGACHPLDHLRCPSLHRSSVRSLIHTPRFQLSRPSRWGVHEPPGQRTDDLMTTSTSFTSGPTPKELRRNLPLHFDGMPEIGNTWWGTKMREATVRRMMTSPTGTPAATKRIFVRWSSSTGRPSANQTHFDIPFRTPLASTLGRAGSDG